MLLGGDEFRRTQRGNNNAYCQDNEVSWFDWSLLGEAQGDSALHSGNDRLSPSSSCFAKRKCSTRMQT